MDDRFRFIVVWLLALCLASLCVFEVVEVCAPSVVIDDSSNFYYDYDSGQRLNAKCNITKYGRFSYDYAVETLNYRAYFKENINSPQFCRFEYLRDSGDDYVIELSIDSVRYRNETDSVDIGQFNNVNATVSANELEWVDVYTGEGCNVTINLTVDYTGLSVSALFWGVAQEEMDDIQYIEVVYELEFSDADCYLYNAGMNLQNSSFNSSKEVYFLDDNGVDVCMLDTPYAIDDEGNTSYGLWYMEYTPTCWVVHKSIDYEWYNSSMREFPLMIDPQVLIGPGFSASLYHSYNRNIVAHNDTALLIVYRDLDSNLHLSRSLDNGTTWGGNDTHDPVWVVVRPGVVSGVDNQYHSCYYSVGDQVAHYIPINQSGDSWLFGNSTDKGPFEITNSALFYDSSDYRMYWFVAGRASWYPRLAVYISIDNGSNWGSNSPDFDNGNVIYMWNDSNPCIGIDQLSVAKDTVNDIIFVSWQTGDYGSYGHNHDWIASNDAGLHWGSNDGTFDDGNAFVIVDGGPSEYNNHQLFVCNGSQLHCFVDRYIYTTSSDLRWYYSNDSGQTWTFDNDTLHYPQEQHEPSVSLDSSMWKFYLLYQEYVSGQRKVIKRVFDLANFNWSAKETLVGNTYAFPDTVWSLNRYGGKGDYLYYSYGDNNLYYNNYNLDNVKPSATIDSPSNASSYDSGSSVAFNVTASDPHDAEYLSYVWSSSRDGIISTSQNFTSSSLSIGNHTVTLTISDSIDSITRYIYVVINATVSGSVSVGGGSSICLYVGGLAILLVIAFLVLSGKGKD